ncbi:MAG: polysaccharide deacetylase family protein [Chlorobium phaeovibrioides]|nr:polysaccharide deacetylase family protein [Chlorobium phaeovibrioides]
MKSILASACIIISFFATFSSAAAKPSPVLLTFDTEQNADVAALKTLDIRVPSTYFITGAFAEANRELVAELSLAGHTIGSHSQAHPHLSQLSQKDLDSDLKRSKRILESITGKPVVWFRAPYMEYDDRVMRVLKANGFRYDSSDSEHWEQQSILTELPISALRRRVMLASDYNMIVVNNFTEPEFEAALKELYTAKSRLGQPAIILLHPKHAARYPEALRNFISWVHGKGGRFLTADGYIAEIEAYRPDRYGIWVDFSRRNFTPEEIVADISRTSATDIFLMAKDTEGNFYYGRNSRDNVFGKTMTLLRKQGVNVKVHAWLPALSDTRAVRRHSDWAMTAQNGRLSANWMSPGNPEVALYTEATVKELIQKYGVDGIHLDCLTYTDLDYDYGKSNVKAFSDARGLPENITHSDLLGKEYPQWLNWRSSMIAAYARKIGLSVQKAAGGAVEYSAAFTGNRVFNYKDVDRSGQEISLIAPAFDFIVPVMHVACLEDDREVLARALVSLRVKSGAMPLVVRLIGPADGGMMTEDYLSEVLEVVSRGANGLGLSSYHFLFGKDPARRCIDEEGLDLINRAFGGKGLKPLPETLGGGFSLDPVSLPGAVAVFLAVVFNMVAIPVYGRKAGQNESTMIAPGLETAVHKWEELAAEMSSGFLTGSSAEEISGMLRSYDARGVHKNRIAIVLDAVTRSASPMTELYEAVSCSMEWKSLALKYLNEVCLLGYVAINDRFVSLTPSGRELLTEARCEGFDYDYWAFVECCLQQTVSVVCPQCGSLTQTHLYWSSFDCSQCAATLHLEDVPTVELLQNRK